MGVYHLRDCIGKIVCDLVEIYVLALGKSDYYFKKLESDQRVIVVLFLVHFFIISRLEIRVNDPRVKPLIRYACLLTELDEIPFLDGWRAVVVSNNLNEDLFEFGIILFENIFDLTLLFEIFCNLIHLP